MAQVPVMRQGAAPAAGGRRIQRGRAARAVGNLADEAAAGKFGWHAK
jgi:hypothetical protein